jgi:hypothetical protein
MPIYNLQKGFWFIHSQPGKCLSSNCRKTPESNYWQYDWPYLHRSGLHDLVKHPPHASILFCNSTVAIFSSSCTKQAANPGKHATSYIKTPEDIYPAIFGLLFHRSNQAFRAVCSPHASQHFKYLLAIFKHAFTLCAHNRACNLSPLVWISEDTRAHGCLTWHRSARSDMINHQPHAHQTFRNVFKQSSITIAQSGQHILVNIHLVSRNITRILATHMGSISAETSIPPGKHPPHASKHPLYPFTIFEYDPQNAFTSWLLFHLIQQNIRKHSTAR